MSIPIAVGISGHRFYNRECEADLRELVFAELSELKSICPDSDMILLDALAAGADLLCAEEALKLGYRLIVPLPFDLELYKEDFSAEDRMRLDALLEKADRVFVADEDRQLSRHEAFRNCGIYIAEHSHVFIALWDGEKGSPEGCGTGDIVDYIFVNNSELKDGSDIPVIHILTPREDSELQPELRLIEKQQGVLNEILSSTNEFNKDSKKYDTEGIEALKQASGALARKAKCKYDSSLKYLAVFGSIMVMAFLFYDEMEAVICLPVYALALILSFAISKKADKDKIQKKYLQYRVLSEALRTQIYLLNSGISANVSDYFTWTQRVDCVWIRKAISVMLIGRAGSDRSDLSDVSSDWIGAQWQYHDTNVKKIEKQIKKNRAVSSIMKACMIAVLATAMVLEFSRSHFLEVVFWGFPVSIWIKVLVGSTGGVTLFISSYYGKLALARKKRESEKMRDLYDMAKVMNGSRNSRSTFYRQLAAEEIIESGNWYSYNSDNEISINI